MKGGFVPEHYTVMMEPEKAAILRHLLRDVREAARAGQFGINEEEDEAAEELIELLAPEGEPVG